MKFALLLFLSLSAGVLHASTNEFSKKFVHLKTGIEIPGYDLTFKGEDSDIKFNPNVKTNLFLGATFKDLFAVSYGLPLPQNKEEKRLKGSTSYTDIRLSFAFKMFMVAGYYSKYKGFYVQDSKEVDATYAPGNPYYRQPGLFAENMGFNFTWIMNSNDFSLISVTEHTARQRKSGGSWLLGAAFDQTTFHDEQAIIPASIRPQYGADQNLQEGRFRALTVNGGYGHYFLLSKKIFVSGVVQIGAGKQLMKIKGSNLNSSGSRSTSRTEAILSVGYAGDDYFGGLAVNASGNSFKTNSIEITPGFWSAKIYFGVRL